MKGDNGISENSPPAGGGVRGGGRWALVAIFLVASFILFRHRPCANFHTAALQTRAQTISLALAQTPDEQSRGLGGCRYIPKDAGMYFMMDPSRIATFWMKNMRIPIDIIWIKDEVVIGVEHNVPHERESTEDSQLKTYQSPGAVDAVLEIAAGASKPYGIEVGSHVHLTK